jgi:transposase-like protein
MGGQRYSDKFKAKVVKRIRESNSASLVADTLGGKPQ